MADDEPGSVTQVLAELDDRLADTDAFLARAYPGEDGRRQPVHTVYVPADRYTADLPAAVGRAGGRAGRRSTAASAALCRTVGRGRRARRRRSAARVEAKLATEPIEDLRLDFEDGYGDREPTRSRTPTPSAVAERLADASAAGLAPPFVGLRFKCFEAPTRRRGAAHPRPVPRPPCSTGPAACPTGW